MFQRIWSLLFGALLVTATVSCSTLDSLLGEERPEASIESVQLSGISLDSAQLAIDLRIDNPYSVAIPVASIEASLFSEDQRLLDTAHDGQLSVPPGGHATVPMTLDLSFPKLLRLVSSLRPGMEVPYRADIQVSVDAPVLGRVAIPLSHDGAFPIPAVPVIRLHDLVLDKAGLTGVSGSVAFDLTNANEFAMEDTKMQFDLKLGDRVLSRVTRLDDLGSISAGEKKTMKLGFNLSATEVGMGLINMISGGSTNLRAQGSLGFDSRFGLIGTEFDTSNDVSIKRN